MARIWIGRVCAVILGIPPVACVQVAPPDAPEPWPPVATFSILGYDAETGEIGGAVQSRVFSVGNGVLWGEADVGMVATQAIVDVSYGPQGPRLAAATRRLSSTSSCHAPREVLHH